MDNLTKKQKYQLKKHNLDINYISNILKDINNNKISYSKHLISNNDIEFPSSMDFVKYNGLDKNNAKIGISAIENGQIRYDIANGGAATRYFDINPDDIKRFKKLKSIKPKDIGLPKCLGKVIGSLNYLDLKLFFHLKYIYDIYGIKIPVHIMNNYLTNDLIRNYINKASKYYKFNFPLTYTVQTPLPRFTYNKNQKDIELYKNEYGNLDFAPPGHGDYLNLVKKTLINKNIKYIIYSNIDNLGAVINPKILGHHIKSGADMTIEICKLYRGDTGGIPLIVKGKAQIVEQFKLPYNFNYLKAPYFNCATYIFSVNALQKLNITLPCYLVVKNAFKNPKQSLKTEKTFQVEHLLGDLSTHLKTNFIIVPREKRFWPIKRYVDLLRYIYPNIKNKLEMEQHYNFMKLLKEEYGISNRIKARSFTS